MTKIESKIIDFFQQHIITVFVLLVTIAGIIMRMSGFGFDSNDYNKFLEPWWNEISANGLGSLNQQVGNYNIPYQICIAVMTYLPFGPLVSYKLLSIAFDFVLAISASLLFRELDGRRSSYKPAFIYGIVFCLVNVVFNSAFWAQCDSIYVAFVLLAIYFIYKNKNIPAFVMLGIAFAFKLQTIFIFPFFLLYYFVTKKCSILHFLIIPVVDVLMCTPAFFFGRNFMDVINVYIDQTGYYQELQMNCPNFYSIMCNGDISSDLFSMIKKFAIMLTFAIIVAMFVFIVYKKADITKPKMLLLVAVWSVWTCVMFLPSMHERYAYMLDILTILLAFMSRKYVLTAVLCNLCTFRGYCYYLFKFKEIDFQLTGIVYVAAYIFFTYQLVKEIIEQTKNNALDQSEEYKTISNNAEESECDSIPVTMDYEPEADVNEQIIITE